MNDDLRTVLKSIGDADDFFAVEVTDVNQRGFWGNTPLKIAAVRGDAEEARILIENGAEVNAVQEDEGTALHYAAAFGHAEVVALLLEHGASVDVIDRFGYSALDQARRSGNPEAIRLIKARTLAP